MQDARVKLDISQEAMLGPGNQFRARDASALAVFLTDLEPTRRIERVHQLEQDYRDANYLATLPMVPSFLIGEGHAATLLKTISTNFLSNVQAMPTVEPVQAWGYKNTALVAQSFVYAAQSHALATCMMEGYDGRKLKDLLHIPDRYAIPLMVAVGYDYEEGFINMDTVEYATPRLPIEEIVFEESFGSPWRVQEEDEEESSTEGVQNDGGGKLDEEKSCARSS